MWGRNPAAVNYTFPCNTSSFIDETQDDLAACYLSQSLQTPKTRRKKMSLSLQLSVRSDGNDPSTEHRRILVKSLFDSHAGYEHIFTHCEHDSATSVWIVTHLLIQTGSLGFSCSPPARLSCLTDAPDSHPTVENCFQTLYVVKV